MGRHAADRPAPEPTGASGRRFRHADLPETRAGRHAEGSEPGPGRPPRHADLFVPAQARAGETQGAAEFEALVRPHRAALRAYVRKLTDGDDAETDSIVKETLYRAAQDPDRFPQRPSAVRPWLVLTARTVLSDGERVAPAGHDDRPDPMLAPEPPRVPVAAETTVLRAMEDLSGTHREILVELFYRGTSLEEAARVQGVPVDAVKSRLYHAMRALRAVIDQQVTERGPDPYRPGPR